MSRLKELFQEYQRKIFLSFLLILVISLSFGLGYLVARENNQAPIIIEKCSSTND